MAEKSRQMRYNERNKEKVRAYDKDTYYKPVIRIRKEETEVINHLKAQPSRSDYILKLVKEDMKKGSL